VDPKVWWAFVVKSMDSYTQVLLWKITKLDLLPKLRESRYRQNNKLAVNQDPLQLCIKWLLQWYSLSLMNDLPLYAHEDSPKKRQ
jgi:hypothetical protein